MIYEIQARIDDEPIQAKIGDKPIHARVDSGFVYPQYEGDYEITPAMYDQTLPTQWTTPVEDIVVKGVAAENGIVTLPTTEGEAKYIDINDKSGAVITAYHAKEDISMAITPIQSGTGDPYPAGGGKNKCPISTLQSSSVAGITWTNNGDGSWTAVTGTATAISYAGGSAQTCVLGVLPAGEYTLTAFGADKTTPNTLFSVRVCVTDVGTYVAGALGSVTFTADGTTNYACSPRVPSGKTVSNDIAWLSCEAGSTATSYAPYSNIRPISGWTGANIYRASKNLIVPYANAGTIYGVSYEVHENGSIFVDGLSSSVAGIEFGNSHAVRYLPPGTYSYKLFGDNISGITIQGWLDGASAFSAAEGTFTIPENNKTNYFRIRCAKNIDYDNITVYPMIIAGSTPPTAWEACNSAIYTVSWQSEAGTVYGGTLDVTLGKLRVTHANIASYNGEELHGEWICDRAVYAPDTTPPTGSQVVYELATPLEYDLTPTEIQLLMGQNNIWADCGDITVTYGIQ